MSEPGDPTADQPADVHGGLAGFGARDEAGFGRGAAGADARADPFDVDTIRSAAPEHSVGGSSLVADAGAAYLDTNHDGRHDMIVRDYDGNGRADLAMADTDFDGRVDAVSTDQNCDGLVDLVQLDGDRDGRLDTSIVDTDHDDRADLVIIDHDGDGVFDLLMTDRDGDGLLEDVPPVDPYVAG
jgi:hypothetical protein